jgi:hypothetical protein
MTSSRGPGSRASAAPCTTAPLLTQAAATLAVSLLAVACLADGPAPATPAMPVYEVSADSTREPDPASSSPEFARARCLKRGGVGRDPIALRRGHQTA